MQTKISIVDSIDQNAPLRRLVKPAKKSDDGALTASGFTYKRYRFAAAYSDVHVCQHRSPLLVFETHMVEDDLADPFLRVIDHQAIADLRFGVEQTLQPLC